MYDAIIIGGGPGGYVTAIRLSQLGKKVALVEKENLGGTCTNQGCIPTKALLTAAHLYSDIISKSKKFGIKVENVTYELAGIMKHMKKSVTMSRKGIEYLMKKNTIDVLKGTGEIIDKNHVRVNGEIIEGDYLVLAHGSVPSKFPPFNEVEGIWTSDDVFKMDKLPESIVIIGGGVIGIEFATFFSTLKKEVTIVELADHILPFEDLDVAEEIKKTLLKKGVKIYEKSKVKKVIKNDDVYSVIVDSDKEFEISSEKVLLAVGRRPNIPEDVRRLGIEIEKGVITDNTMKTNIDNVYAIGDIRAKIMLAHVAMFEGIVAAHNIAGENMKMDYSAIPSIIFSNPEVASTGLKEKDLDPEKIIVGKFPVSANGRARTMEERDGFAKVIIDKKTKKVLGFSVVSASATDMIMEGVLAVKYGLTLEQVVNSIHPHPTLTETILGSFESAEGMALHI
ncbi:dihydrolipoamide dehydrogenase [Marinitoga hydrogenitolerans DSM 16785]|uniref:Dihydrolipoyl dehydrogenase n=1 Tax=Marinitoga hydrogenitolerans (strain DSM 16785 / JCM 12826 / AT1271) TaxID=1122195 RepID=A0A1M4VAM4_MARH1|nr:dihydrolipoyl dehydrogenase [Marinitoga hydrogenitolerans]SHE65858.1 dihydrolipoamide dehydrogenase [Marinitoga hydrogenitolerans DSM 16785]